MSTNVYDQTDQLLSSSGTNSYTATYDAVGNRQTADGWRYTVNNLNQYTQIINGSTTNNLSYDDNGNVSSFNGVTLEHDSQPAYCTDADVFAQETPQDKWIGESIWQRPTPTIGMRCQLSALRAHVAGGLGQHAGQGQLVGANVRNNEGSGLTGVLPK